MVRRLVVSRWSGPALLFVLLLACFGRLVVAPSDLIVDADRPSLDHARRSDDAPSFGNDATRLFIPHHAAIAGHLARLGRVPTWDDRGFGGRPLVGNPQAGLFYPPHWIAWRFWTPSILGWIVVAHMFWAGLGTYSLSRSIGLDRWSSTVAAGCFQASPYVLAQAFEGHYPHVYSASWMPWAFLAALGLRRGSHRSGLILIPILTLAGVAGHPQEVYYLIIALAFWGAGHAIALTQKRQPGKAFRFCVAVLLLATLTLGAGAIEWLPDMLAGRWALRRSTLAIAEVGRYHLFPVNLLQLLSPFALGRPGDYFGHDNYWEALTSIGLIPLFLASAGITWSPHRTAVRGWATLALVAILFAAGRRLGVFAVFYHVIPGMDRFRVPSRALFLASLGASMLAGLGVDALRRFAGQPTFWSPWIRLTSRAAIVLAGTVLIGGSIAERLDLVGTLATSRPFTSALNPIRRGPGDVRIPEIDRWLRGLDRVRGEPAFWLALGGASLTAFWARRRPGDRRRVAAVMGLLGLVELGFYGHSLLVTAPIARLLGPDPIGDVIGENILVGQHPGLIRADDSLLDGFKASLRGFRMTDVYDSFQLQHSADLYETLYRPPGPDRLDHGRPMDAAASEFRRSIRQGVLDRMGVAVLVSGRLDPDPGWTRIASGSQDGSDYAVYRNPTALPRAYVVPRAEMAVDDARVTHRFPTVDPRDAVLMTTDPIAASLQRQPFVPAEWRRAEPDVQILEVLTNAPGLLVVGDAWMPGWRAEVDGHPATIERGNRAQRVISLETSQRHRISLIYRPPGLVEGSILTLSSIGAWIALFAYETKRAKVKMRQKTNQRVDEA